jgi:hypothetical protein
MISVQDEQKNDGNERFFCGKCMKDKALKEGKETCHTHTDHAAWVIWHSSGRIRSQRVAQIRQMTLILQPFALGV